jgi:hypothetical protein
MAVGGLAGFATTYLVMWLPLFAGFVVLALVARAARPRTIRSGVAVYAPLRLAHPGEEQMLVSLPERRRALRAARGARGRPGRCAGSRQPPSTWPTCASGWAQARRPGTPQHASRTLHRSAGDGACRAQGRGRGDRRRARVTGAATGPDRIVS